MRLLWWLKLRGNLRRQWHRLRTPKGAFLSLIGVGLFLFWIMGLILRVGWGASLDSDVSHLPERSGLWAAGLSAVTLAGAFAHRGLFLPKDEIERLFSAPLTRRDLIRYRLSSNAMRSLVGGLFIGLMLARMAPQPWLAFLGVVLAMQTLTVAQQCLAMLLGMLEASVSKFLQRILFFSIPLLGLVLLLLFLFDPFEPRSWGDSALLGRISEWLTQGREQPLDHPLVHWITLPFHPWTSMVSALSPAEFWLWFLVCAGIQLVLLELTVRLPVDFRELSMDTAASVASRIKRTRRGGGASAGKASTRLLAARVPWIFGRGPGGAVAWRKTGAMLRKARGTLTVSFLVLSFITVLAMVLGRTGVPSFVIPAGIAMVGTLYLCAGLRFDFRDELDRMDVIRAWPLAPQRLFVCMLLPEALLVSVLLIGSLAVHALWIGALSGLSLGIMLVLPLLVFDWIALDNAVFIFSPVRFVPGQEGMLQNAGRGILMLLLRALMALLVGGLAGLAFYVAGWLTERLEGPEWSALVSGFLALFIILLLSSMGLARLGGFVLKRFDVAQDRG